MDDFMDSTLVDLLQSVQDLLGQLASGAEDFDLDADTVTLPAVEGQGDTVNDLTDATVPGVVDPFLSALSAGTDNHVLGSVILPSPFAPGYWA